MVDFFTNSFLRGLPSNSDSYVSLWASRSMLMLLVCFALAYLITLLLLSFTTLFRSHETEPLVDVDARIHLCFSWTLLFPILVVTLCIVWLWYHSDLV